MSALGAARVPGDARLNQAAQERVLVQFTSAQARLANVAGFGMAWTDGQPGGRLEFLLFVTQKYPAKSLTERDIIQPLLDKIVNSHKAQQGQSEAAVRVVDTAGLISSLPFSDARHAVVHPLDTAIPASFLLTTRSVCVD